MEQVNFPALRRRKAYLVHNIMLWNHTMEQRGFQTGDSNFNVELAHLWIEELNEIQYILEFFEGKKDDGWPTYYYVLFLILLLATFSLSLLAFTTSLP